VGTDIRAATPEDAGVLASLRFAFRAALSTPRESEPDFVVRCAAWMREQLAGDAWRCWIAEFSGEPVGNLWVQLVEKVPNPGDELERHAYLTSFFVREPARGAGVGTALLAAALAWCDAHQVDAVFLWSQARSRPLYLRHGFVAPDTVLTRQRAHLRG
jgi:GNAT superfamily N-acetyltransferase